MLPQETLLNSYLSDVVAFTEHFIGVVLHPYQAEAARAIVRSVFAQDGETFVVIFARQSGKDEMLANLILYLLVRFFEINASMVIAQPTFQPQTIVAMERFKLRVQGSFFRRIKRTAGQIFRHRSARISYLSAHPSANVVSATADRLLIGNEAQDILPDVWDKKFVPMAASGNATRVLSGTSWTKDTLLERELRLALEREKQDGKKRAFIADAYEVGRWNPFYKAFFESEVRKLGIDHPLIQTQYLCKTLDAQAGMFNATRRALMKGDQNAEAEPVPGAIYLFALDIAGQDESRLADPERALTNPGRDAMSLTVARADLSTLATLQAPIFRIIHRQQWTGKNHLVVFGQLKALADRWRPQHIVIDATGVGEGLWAMLDKAYPTKVLPVKFSAPKKSEIGYRYIAMIETGRVRDCVPSVQADREYMACTSEVLIGPQKTMRWGVPEGTRDENGELIHDDIVMADALLAEADALEWVSHSPTQIVRGHDPLEEMSRIR